MNKFNGGHYQAYLLRLWRDSDAEPWHAMVQDVLTGERHQFATLALLLNFLAIRTKESLVPPIKD